MRIKWAENNREKNAYDLYLSMSALEYDRKSAMPDQVSRIILIITNVVHATVCMWVHVLLARIGCTRWPFFSRSKSHCTVGEFVIFSTLLFHSHGVVFPIFYYCRLIMNFLELNESATYKKKNCFVREIFEIFVPYLLKWSVLHTCTSTHALGKNIVRSVDLSIIKVVCIEIDYVFCLSHLILETNNTPRRKTEIFFWQWKYLYYYLHSFRLTLLTFTNESDSTQLTRRCFDVRNDIDACVFVCNKEIGERLFVCIYLRCFYCSILF